MEFELAGSNTSQERMKDLGGRGLCSEHDEFKTLDPARLVLRTWADSQGATAQHRNIFQVFL